MSAGLQRQCYLWTWNWIMVIKKLMSFIRSEMSNSINEEAGIHVGREIYTVMLCLSYPQWCPVYLFTPLIWRLISKDWMLLYKFKTVFYFRGSSIRDDVWKRLLLRQKWGWTIIFLYFIFVNKVVKSYLVPDWFTIEVVKSYLVPNWFTILSY